MALDDSGKQARLLPCLAILRYTVATVVTVLAVVVIVMVIAVGVRPDDVNVSVVQGHVATSDLWEEMTTTTTTYDVNTEPSATTISRRGPRPVNCIGTGGGRGAAELGSCSGSGGRVIYGRPLTRTVYTPAKILSLEVYLNVENRSGRGIIYCKSINVSFYAGSAAEGMNKIGMLQLPRSLDFNVKPQTSHVIGRVVTFNDATMLKKIADTYGGEFSFKGTVEVTMNTSFVVFKHHSTPITITLVCSPVDFSVGYASDTATSVQCAKSS
jgi:hypothetical protein